MYKVFLRFPEALRPAFPRLKEKLEDPDSGELSGRIGKQKNLMNVIEGTRSYSCWCVLWGELLM